MTTHPAMLEFARLMNRIRDEIGRKRTFALEIEKKKYWGSGVDPMEYQITIGFEGESVTGSDPEEVLTEVLRRAGWQKRQSSLALSAPTVVPTPAREAIDVEAGEPIEPAEWPSVKPPSSAPEEPF